MKHASTTPQAISLRWCLLYIPVFAITAALLAWGYDQMPDPIPIHINWKGDVNDWIPKGPQVFSLPLGVMGFLAACMVFCQWTMTRAQRNSGLGEPESDDWAFALFIRAQSIALLWSGLALCLSIGVTIALAMMEVITLIQSGIIISFVALAMVAVCVVISIIYGNAGSRLHRQMLNGEASPLADYDEVPGEASPLAGSDAVGKSASTWRGGLFYVNRDDPHLLVPKRYGIGWTVNFGRKGAWITLLVIAAVTCAFVGLFMLE